MLRSIEKIRFISVRIMICIFINPFGFAMARVAHRARLERVSKPDLRKTYNEQSRSKQRISHKRGRKYLCFYVVVMLCRVGSNRDSNSVDSWSIQATAMSRSASNMEIRSTGNSCFHTFVVNRETQNNLCLILGNEWFNYSLGHFCLWRSQYGEKRRPKSREKKQ